MAIPVFLPGKFHGQRSLVGYSPWGCKDSHMAGHKHTHRYNLTPKETRKRKQTKPNITRKKEMIKIRAEKNEKERR